MPYGSLLSVWKGKFYLHVRGSVGYFLFGRVHQINQEELYFHILYLNDWQRERQRLSRACLGHADAVRTGEDLGHAVDLQT